MYSMKEKYANTISMIEYSDSYEENSELFDQGVDILKRRLENDDFSEFNNDEEETLCSIFVIIQEEDN